MQPLERTSWESFEVYELVENWLCEVQNSDISRLPEPWSTSELQYRIAFLPGHRRVHSYMFHSAESRGVKIINQCREAQSKNPLSLPGQLRTAQLPSAYRHMETRRAHDIAVFSSL